MKKQLPRRWLAATALSALLRSAPPALSDPALSDTDRATRDAEICQGVWKPYVTLVSELAAALDSKPLILFVSRSGDVFNCLGENYPDAMIARMENGWKANPFFDRLSPLTEDPADWPDNVCSVFLSFGSSPEVMSIHLPMEAKVLNTEMCRVDIYNTLKNSSLNRMRDFNRRYP